MTDSPVPEERNIQVVSRLADLPRGGHCVDISEAMQLTNADRERMVLWSVLPRGTSPSLNGEPVWMVAVEGFEKELKFYSIKRNISRAGYRLEKVVYASDPALIRIIQDSAPDEEEFGATQKNSITDFYEEMVSAALRERVSDIHIELRKTTAVVRMRRHGQMMIYKEISTKFCVELCTVIYNVLAETKDVSFMPTEYQAAALNTRIGSEEVKLRYQSLPAYPEGFDVVLRVLPLGGDDEGTPDISVLGYSPSQVQDMMKIVAKPVGALLIVGTTGSGKSTTLKNLLMLINESRGYRCKIYTIEDPPEYKIPRVSQIPVIRRKSEDYTKKSPFEEPLIATMRGDPDILMIGEVRDKFTGDGLKKGTQSGHQMLSTLHAGSALGAVERLEDFGITPSVMGSPEFINGLIYQKLLPILCQHCAVAFSDVLGSSAATTTEIDLATRLSRVSDLENDSIRLRNHHGCEKCRGIGVVGRTVCAEVIVPDFTMLRLFRERSLIEAKAYWRGLSDRNRDSDNMTGKTALEHALSKMRKGIVSPHDVEDQLGPVDAAEVDWEEIQKVLASGVGQPGTLGSRGTGAAWNRDF